MDDLANYKVVPRKVLETDLGDYTLHTMPSPTGGPIVSHILNIIKGMLLLLFYSFRKYQKNFGNQVWIKNIVSYQILLMFHRLILE